MGGLRRSLIGVAAAAVAVALVPAADAAYRGETVLAEPGDGYTWEGEAPVSGSSLDGCGTLAHVVCDVIEIEIGQAVELSDVLVAEVETAHELAALDLFLYDAGGLLRARSSAQETLTADRLEPGSYELRIGSFVVAPSPDEPVITYRGSVVLASAEDHPQIDPPPAMCDRLPTTWLGEAVDDDGSLINLEVLVLLDGLTADEMAPAVARASEVTYEPLGLRLVPEFQLIDVPADGTHFDGELGERPTLHYESAFQAARDATEGQRPPGTDLVYLATVKDLWGGAPAPWAGPHSISGVAHCIGGVASPSTAYAVGEAGIDERESTTVPPLRGIEFTAHVLAHELGHLLGGGHQDANCAEGAPHHEESRGRTCTIMFPLVGPSWLSPGTTEGAMFRGLASRYARP